MENFEYRLDCNIWNYLSTINLSVSANTVKEVKSSCSLMCHGSAETYIQNNVFVWPWQRKEEWMDERVAFSEIMNDAGYKLASKKIRYTYTYSEKHNKWNCALYGQTLLPGGRVRRRRRRRRPFHFQNGRISPFPAISAAAEIPRVRARNLFWRNPVCVVYGFCCCCRIYGNIFGCRFKLTLTFIGLFALKLTWRQRPVCTLSKSLKFWRIFKKHSDWRVLLSATCASKPTKCFAFYASFFALEHSALVQCIFSFSSSSSQLNPNFLHTRSLLTGIGKLKSERESSSKNVERLSWRLTRGYFESLEFTPVIICMRVYKMSFTKTRCKIRISKYERCQTKHVLGLKFKKPVLVCLLPETMYHYKRTKTWSTLQVHGQVCLGLCLEAWIGLQLEVCKWKVLHTLRIETL